MKSRWGSYVVIFKNGYHGNYGCNSYESVGELKSEIRESFEEQVKDIIKIVFIFGVQLWAVEGSEQIEQFMNEIW